MTGSPRHASVAPHPDGFALIVDRRLATTPAGRGIVLPTLALASALAEEWRTRSVHVAPATMPLTRMACSTLDLTASSRLEILTTLAGFGETDLLCHRAPFPADLAARQAAAWQPWLDWVARAYGIDLAVTIGLLPVRQPAASLDRLRHRLEGCDAWTLMALHVAVPRFGSVILGLAVIDSLIDAAACLDLALLDENFQAERWGSDPLALSRLQGLHQEVAAAMRFLGLARPTNDRRG